MTPARAHEALKRAALAYPGAWEDHPWGETVAKVGKKVFVFLGRREGGGFGASFKLPDSGEAATTMFSWAEPTGYGLGKSGWVTASFAKGEDVPIELLLQWLEESYRAVAPKRALKTTAPSRAPRSRRPRRAARRRAE